MESKNGQVYILQGADDAGTDEPDWVSPRPVGDVVTDAVVAASDLDAADLDDLEEYVDREDLEAVLRGPETEVTFSVEGHAVTLTDNGDVDVTAE